MKIIDARREHITLLNEILKKAKRDDRDLRAWLGDPARHLMKHFIHSVERKLNDVAALQCDGCGVFVLESDLVTVSTRFAEDQNPAESLICPDCILCPPDEADR